MSAVRALVALLGFVLASACGSSSANAPLLNAPPPNARPQPVGSAAVQPDAQPAAHTHAGAQAPKPSAQPAWVVAPPVGAIVLGGDLAALHANKPVSFLLRTDQAVRLLGRFAPNHPEARLTEQRDPSGVVMEQGVVMGQGALPTAIAPRHRSATFLIDFDQPVFVELASQLSTGAELPALRALVAKRFEKISYGTVWTASRAATLRQGDCTEHAVVLAALARARGLPARVVLGYIMITDGAHGLALGHAWTEVHDGASWLRMDATPFGAEAAEGTAYLILGELEEEGPGYARSLTENIAILQVSGVDVVAPQLKP